jgi:hypothetical protein
MASEHHHLHLAPSHRLNGLAIIVADEAIRSEKDHSDFFVTASLVCKSGETNDK